MHNGLPKSRFWGNIYGGWPCVMGFRSRICRLNEPGLWGGGWPYVMGFRGSCFLRRYLWRLAMASEVAFLRQYLWRLAMRNGLPKSHL